MRNTSIQVSRFYKDEVALSPDERKEMRDRRNANRKRLKNGLAYNEDPKPIGCRTQGSYAMRTMVQDDNWDYDIDDGVYFKAAELVGDRGGEMSALAVREMVCAALQDDKFAKAPEVQKNCVRVYYDAGYHVDVPAYRRHEVRDSWGTVSYSYELASSSWRKSDARAVTKWFNERVTDLAPVANDDQFRRVVRLLKFFAKSRSSWKGKNLSGFAITKIASDLFRSSAHRDDESLRETMAAIAGQLAWSQQIQHPVVDELLSDHENSKAIHFRDRLLENLAHLNVLDDPSCTHDDAMAAWDKVFCTEWFSDQSPPDDGDAGDGPEGGSSNGGGSPKAAVRKEGGGRFAGS